MPPFGAPPYHSQRALAGHWVCYIYLRCMLGGALLLFWSCNMWEGFILLLSWRAFFVNSDRSGLHCIVIQLCQHGVCWVGVTTFSHFTASLDMFQVALYHKLSLCYHFVDSWLSSTVNSSCYCFTIYLYLKELVYWNNTFLLWLHFSCRRLKFTYLWAWLLCSGFYFIILYR